MAIISPAVTVTIAGNDVSEDVISLRMEQDICRVAQICTITLDATTGAHAYNPWDSLVVAINGVNRLTGYVSTATKGRDGYEVQGIDTMKRALDTFIDTEVEVTEEKDAGWWIDYWLTEVGITSSGSVETGKTVPGDVNWQYRSVSDIILECLGYAGGGGTVIVDGDGIAQIIQKTIGAADHTTNWHLKFSRTQDDSWYRDRAVVFGKGVVAEKPDTPPAYPRTAALSSGFIQTQGSADGLAQDILDFFDENLDIKRCLIPGDESIWLGETARVVDSWTGYDNAGLITSIETGIDEAGYRMLVSVDEKCGFIWGWGPEQPHMAYTDWTNWNLKYATKDSEGTWIAETVDDSAGTGYFQSIAVDSGGYPHISYYDYTNNDLKYAYRDADGWHIEIVDNGDPADWGYLGSYNSIVMDSGDYPHISYADEEAETLKYAYKNAGGWHITTVDTNLAHWPVFTHQKAIALDSGEFPHIIYHRHTTPVSVDRDLKYAYKDGSGWHTEIAVNGVASTGYFAAMVLDDSDCPHTSYMDSTNGNIGYAYKDGTGWHAETVAFYGAPTMLTPGTSIKLDSGGYPHIAYQYIQSPGDDRVQYAYKNGTGWHAETPFDWNTYGPCLDLGNNDYPHIGFYDGAADDLIYAHKDANGWHTEVADSTDNVGDGASLVLG